MDEEERCPDGSNRQISGALRRWENIEGATRQTEGQKEDLWKKFEEDRKNTAKDLEKGMGKSNKSYK